ncbi:MAG: hypothetical protein R3360_10090, partial [Alphaproteobacteria bacterium]|nr:hypothetical protein [Alphaproteobacteria bacterium]
MSGIAHLPGHRMFRGYAARTLFGLAIVLSSVSAVEAAPEIGAEVDAVRPAYQDNAYGAYLSGRLAGVERDLSEAADLFLRALEHDPENVTLMEEAFPLALMGGRVRAAVDLAHRLVDAGVERTDLMDLVLVVDYLSAGQLDGAAEVAETMSRTGISGLMAPLVNAWVKAGQGEGDAALEAVAELGETEGYREFQLMHQAMLLEYLGRDEEARAAYRKLINATGADDAHIVASYGQFLEKIGSS